AMGSTIAGPKADNDAREELMDTTQTSMAVIFQSPPASHEAVGGTTASLLHTSDTHRMGTHPPVSPGPIQCHGRLS
ncbi:Phenylalanine-4-Hydroxylase, partial [Manis pentadactyla]